MFHCSAGTAPQGPRNRWGLPAAPLPNRVFDKGRRPRQMVAQRKIGEELAGSARAATPRARAVDCASAECYTGSARRQARAGRAFAMQLLKLVTAGESDEFASEESFAP